MRSTIAGDLASFADREKFLLGELEKYKEMRNDHFKRRNEAEKSRQSSVNVSRIKNFNFNLYRGLPTRLFGTGGRLVDMCRRKIILTIGFSNGVYGLPGTLPTESL